MDFVVSCGIFDGVHLGHQALLRQALALGPVKLVSFDPHPLQVLRPELAHHLLFDLQDRRQRLLQASVSELEILPFQARWAQASAEDFVAWILKQKPRAWILGPDFHFGRNREGNWQWLQKRSLPGVDLVLVQTYQQNEARVSTSLIKSVLSEGRLREAADYLGRSYFLRGSVIRGQGLGKNLGFPTANIDPSVSFRPRFGVYLTRASWRSQTYFGLTNIGQRPSVRASLQGSPQVEVHLFDFSEDLYGEFLELEFLEFIREERKFSNVEALRNQIGKDVEKMKLYLHDSRGSFERPSR
ncbi:MAG: riboflavin biosynthesis protein RibF [Bdellovibrio sp.]